MDEGVERARILVVDDEPANLKLLREILRRDYALAFARSGEEMLRYAASGPDLILLDIMMPEMDGFEACARLKADPVTRDIPVIFVTARIEPEDEVRGLEAGAMDYLTKPVQGALVRARVRLHLQLREARRVIERQNEELRQAARLRDDVEQIVRHDLKGPLNTIIGMPGVVIDDLKLEPERARSLQAIEDAGFRMLEMINRSHDLFKMERGTYPLQPVPVDLLTVLSRIASELQQGLRSKQLALRILVDGHPPGPSGWSFVVTGEELLCHSMLSNLLKNGMEAAPDGGALWVSLEHGEGEAWVWVGNQGSVPEEIRERFFDKYVTAGKRQGMGLGTYSARLIATTLGGEIQLDASREGETRIGIRLPVREGLPGA